MICEGCNKDKPDVEEVLDPYCLEINDEEVWIVVCGDCYIERALDI
jgi:hypothetical protein